MLLTVDEDDNVDEEDDTVEEDVATKVSIHYQGPGQQNLLGDTTINVGRGEVVDDETTGATWYRFKTDLPPQYSFGLSAQTILQGLGFAIVLVLTDPALMTLPQ